jgi:integrase
MKLTDKTVAALTLGDKDDVIHFDDTLKGFGFRIRRSGGKEQRTWVVQYKKGRLRGRPTLGPAEVLGAEQARAAAKKVLAQVWSGEDPQADKRDRANKDRNTFATVVAEYLKQKRDDWADRSYVEAERYLTDDYFAVLHRMPLDQIALRDVASAVVRIQRERGSPTAARARGALAALFTWAMRMGLTGANPTIGSINPETKARERVLSGDELVRIWRACADDHYGKIVKLLILTGCRRAEIGDMTWSEIDSERGTFTIPAERAKTGKARTIPLLPMITDILKDMPRMASRDQLFGERSHGFTAWHKGKAALDHRCGVEGWTVHDIRRSVATHMAEQLAVQPHIVELVLGHEFRSGVQATYNRAPYAREISNAYLCWHDYLRGLIGGERKVIPMTLPVS